jgi:hypothetical protein
LEGWGFVVRENPANGANTVPVIMEHEAATGQGAGDVTTRRDGQSGIVDDGGVGDTVAEGEREADDSWWVSMTFSQDIIGVPREGVGAPIPSLFAVADMASRLRSWRATTGERTGNPMRAIVAVATQLPSRIRRESQPRSLNSLAR